jgi:hypothetical protein
VSPNPFPLAANFLDAGDPRRKTKPKLVHLHAAFFGHNEVTKLMDEHENAEDNNKNDNR